MIKNATDVSEMLAESITENIRRHRGGDVSLTVKISFPSEPNVLYPCLLALRESALFRVAGAITILDEPAGPHWGDCGLMVNLHGCPPFGLMSSRNLHAGLDLPMPGPGATVKMEGWRFMALTREQMDTQADDLARSFTQYVATLQGVEDAPSPEEGHCAPAPKRRPALFRELGRLLSRPFSRNK